MEESGSLLETAGLASTAQGPVITHAMTSDEFHVPLHTHPLVAAPAGRMQFKAVIDTKRGAQHEHVQTTMLSKNASLQRSRVVDYNSSTKKTKPKTNEYAPAKVSFTGDICSTDPKNLARLLLAKSGVDAAWHIPDTAFDKDFEDSDLKAFKASVSDHYADVTSISDILKLHQESWFGGFTEGTIG